MKRLRISTTVALLVAAGSLPADHFAAVRTAAQGGGVVEFYLLRPPPDTSFKMAGAFDPSVLVDSRYGIDRPEYTNVPYPFFFDVKKLLTFGNAKAEIRNVQSVCVQEQGKSLGCLGYKQGLSLDEQTIGLRQLIRVPMAPGAHSFTAVLSVPGQKPVDVGPLALSVMENRTTPVRLQFKDTGIKALGAGARAVNDAFCDGLLWKCRTYGSFSVASSYQIEAVLPVQPSIADLIALSEMLSANDWTIRWNALNAIGQIGDASVLEPMSNCLDDQNVEVVMLAARLLSKILRQAQNPSLSERVFQFLAKSLQSKDWGVRAGAIEIMGDFGDARGLTLLSTFKSSDASLQGLDPAPKARGYLSGVLRKAAEGATNKLNGKGNAR